MHTEMPLYQIVKKGTVNLNKLLRLDMVVALTLEEIRGITLSYTVSGCVPCLSEASSARVYDSDLGTLLNEAATRQSKTSANHTLVTPSP